MLHPRDTSSVVRIYSDINFGFSFMGVFVAHNNTGCRVISFSIVPKYRT